MAQINHSLRKPGREAALASDGLRSGDRPLAAPRAARAVEEASDGLRLARASSS